MRVAFAVFLFIHAAAHVVGFLSQSFLVGVEDRGSNPAYLLSSLDRDHGLVRALGVVWLVCAVGFAIAGIGVLQQADWTIPVLVAATVVSTAMSVMWVREAPFGLVANLIVIVVLVVPALHDRVFTAIGIAPPLGHR